MYYIIYDNRLIQVTLYYIRIYIKRIMYSLVRVPLIWCLGPPNICRFYTRGIGRVTQGCNSFHDIVILYDMTKNGIISVSPIRRRFKINVRQKYNTSDWFYTTRRLTIYIHTNKRYSARAPACVLNIITITRPLL